MRFPNAAKGVNKIFIAEVFGLVGIISALAAYVFLLIAGINSQGNEDAGASLALCAIICGIVGYVITVVAFILRIIGVVQAKKDEESFGTALIFVALGEGVAIYGFLIAFLILSKLPSLA